MSAARNMTLPLASARSEPASQATLLGELAALATRLSDVEAEQSYLADSADEASSADLIELLQAALAIVSALEELDAAPADLDFGQDWEPETWVGVRAREPAAPRLGDVCFACKFELNRALRALDRAPDVEARLSAAEGGRRKLYRAIHAVVRAAPASQSRAFAGDESLDLRARAELASALAVRKLYAEFRRNLRRAEHDGSEGVLTALRYAAGALATLTASPHYRALRVSDGQMLRRQRERLLEWSRSGRPAGSGLQLLDDIWTSADLLRDINRRQELRAHDTELIRALARSTSLDRAAWLVSLERLAGLDDTLDELTARLRVSADHHLFVDILLQLSRLV